MAFEGDAPISFGLTKGVVGGDETTDERVPFLRGGMAIGAEIPFRLSGEVGPTVKASSCGMCRVSLRSSLCV